MILKRFWALILAWITIAGLQGQAAHGTDLKLGKGIFRHITIDDGLSNTWISDIYQDQNGIMWFATQYGVNRYDGTKFENYYYDGKDTSSLSNNWAMCIDGDQNGHIWVGTYGWGINEFIPGVNQVQRSFSTSNSVCGIKHIRKVHVDQNGNKWMLAGYRYLYFVKEGNECPLLLNDEIIGLDITESDHSIWVATPDGIFQFAKNDPLAYQLHLQEYKVNSILYEDGRLYFTSEGQLYQLEIDHDLITNLELLSPSIGDIQDMDINNGILWMASSAGLYSYNIANEEITWYHEDDKNVQGDTPLGLGTVHADRQGNIWVGGRKGLSVLTHVSNPFESPAYPEGLQKHQEVRAITSDQNYIWIGAKNGLWRYPRNESNQQGEQILAVPIRSLLFHTNGDLYAGAGYKHEIINQSGIYRIDTSTLDFELFQLVDENRKIERYGQIWDIEEDEHGNIFIAMSGFLLYYDVAEESFQYLNDRINFDFRKADFIIDIILEDEYLWFSTTQAGLGRLNLNNLMKWENGRVAVDHYHVDAEGDKKLASNIIMDMYRADDNTLWLCTDGGIEVYDLDNNSFRQYTKNTHDLIDDKTVAVIEDASGRKWLSTISHGLLMIDEEIDLLTYYLESDGIYHNASLMGANHRSKDGYLFIANESGVQIFNPEEINQKIFSESQILFSNLNINKFGIETNYLLSDDKEVRNEIILSHVQNNLNFSFAFPEYRYQKKYLYEYQLGNEKTSWQSVRDISNIHFANLSPGDYNLVVKACHNAHCVYSEVLSITIQPPWWFSITAIILYIISLIIASYLIIRRVMNQRLQRLYVEQEKEIMEVKSRFFVNMAHELRTPLTLIKGPVERILNQSNILKPSQKKELKKVQQHTDQLSQLIDNVLDLSKADAHVLQFQPISTKLEPFVYGIVESFKAIALEKSVQIIFVPELHKKWCLIDREKVRIILSNLLSNAIKYSNSHRQIYLNLRSHEKIELEVKDQGIGMSQDQLGKVFGRFYRSEQAQMAEGTGIGLSLVKELVEFLEGSIVINSMEGHGTTVRVSLPLTESLKLKEASNGQASGSWIYKGTNEGELPSILICEDNQQIAQFIIDGLSENYKIKHAINGAVGYKMGVEHIPDLILTDVMMPIMDGFELCKRIKQNPLTDHIPVIYLTARGDPQSRYQGFKNGGDGYLRKPFSDVELQQLIHNKIRTQQKLYKKLYQKPILQLQPKESPLLRELEATFWRLWEFDDVSIEDICKAMHISRTQLHRKIKTLKNQSTSQFINELKLKKATKMLVQEELSIGEVSFECAFKDPSYFAQLFLKTYACSPSEFREKSNILTP